MGLSGETIKTESQFNLTDSARFLEFRSKHAGIVLSTNLHTLQLK
jgi:hypothetical protein